MVLKFNNPIEQFNYTSIYCIQNSNFVLYFYILILFLILILYISYNYSNFDIDLSIFFMKYLHGFYQFSNKFILELQFIPNVFQYICELSVLNFVIFYKSLLSWENRIIYLYIFFNSILFVVLSNLIGLIPYSFAITAQIFITINLALYLFISFNIVGFVMHGINLFNIFIPNGVNIQLQILLIPIEIISYMFRPISLSIRLFANIMAGHTLLKVICSFIYNFLKLDLFIFLNFFPFIILIILFALELFVALIQSYVFFILISLFLKDIVKLDH